MKKAQWWMFRILPIQGEMRALAAESFDRDEISDEFEKDGRWPILLRCEYLWISSSWQIEHKASNREMLQWNGGRKLQHAAGEHNRKLEKQARWAKYNTFFFVLQRSGMFCGKLEWVWFNQETRCTIHFLDENMILWGGEKKAVPLLQPVWVLCPGKAKTSKITREGAKMPNPQSIPGTEAR